MKAFRRIFNPLIAFIGIQLVWIILVVFWIYWFLGSHRRLRELASKYSPELLQGGIDWVILVEGLVLLVVILVGVYVIFLYWNKQVRLYREQKNIVSQITHELKSPLASLQLHLETIKLHHPEGEKLDGFIDTMLGDADRLNRLISNLLSANRLEQKGLRLVLRRVDFSTLVRDYFERHRQILPPGGVLNLTIEEGLFAQLEEESIHMVLRNLLENAILYSYKSPVIDVSLSRDGRFCHLMVADHGRGLERRYRKKIFRRFYRVRRGKETIKGSGLGLFIVAAVIRRHKGKVWAESDGINQGTAIHVVIPQEEV